MARHCSDQSIGSPVRRLMQKPRGSRPSNPLQQMSGLNTYSVMLMREFPAIRRPPQPRPQQLPLEDEFLRQPVEEPVEQLLVRPRLLRPGIAPDRHHLVERL